jgi:hypothetical protein
MPGHRPAPAPGVPEPHTAAPPEPASRRTLPTPRPSVRPRPRPNPTRIAPPYSNPTRTAAPRFPSGFVLSGPEHSIFFEGLSWSDPVDSAGPLWLHSKVISAASVWRVRSHGCRSAPGCDRVSAPLRTRGILDHKNSGRREKAAGTGSLRGRKISFSPSIFRIPNRAGFSASFGPVFWRGRSFVSATVTFVPWAKA